MREHLRGEVRINRKGKIMTTTYSTAVQQGLELIASNVRYGLAQRGIYQAEGLCELLPMSEERAREVYDSGEFMVSELPALAAFFGVRVEALLRDNLIVDEHDPDCWDRLVTAQETGRGK